MTVLTLLGYSFVIAISCVAIYFHPVFHVTSFRERAERKTYDFVYKVLEEPEFVNRISGYRIHRIVKRVVARVNRFYGLPEDGIFEHLLIILLKSSKTKAKTAEWLWKEVANPNVQEAIISSPALPDSRKVELALERLANPSVPYYSF